MQNALAGLYPDGLDAARASSMRMGEAERAMDLEARALATNNMAALRGLYLAPRIKTDHDVPRPGYEFAMQGVNRRQGSDPYGTGTIFVRGNAVDHEATMQHELGHNGQAEFVGDGSSGRAGRSGLGYAMAKIGRAHV